MTPQPESNMGELGLKELNRVSGGAVGPDIRSHHVVGPEFAGRHIIGPEIAGVRSDFEPNARIWGGSGSD